MTHYETIIFVEGTDNDPIFYDAIAERYEKETGRKTQIRLADELPNAAARNKGGAGGKITLVRAATFLERWRNAESTRQLQGKEIAFCVDKDIDDLLNKLSSCSALIYTPLHSVENHIVVGADLHRAICIAISSSFQLVRDEIGDCNNLRQIAHRWRDWVVYCILSLRLNLTNSGNYKQESPFNTPAHIDTNAVTASTKFNEAKQQSGITEELFNENLRQAEELVDQLIREMRFDEVFKGRWYASIFYSLIESSGKLAKQCRNCGKNGLWIGIRSTFVLSENVYRHYADSFSRLR